MRAKGRFSAEAQRRRENKIDFSSEVFSVTSAVSALSELASRFFEVFSAPLRLRGEFCLGELC
jgi:hypothetical protein